jgi:hypothetical protein
VKEKPCRALLLGIVSFIITMLNRKTDSISKYATAVKAATLEKAPEPAKQPRQNVPRYGQFPAWHRLEGESTRPRGVTLVIGIRRICQSTRIADLCRMRTGSPVVRSVEFFLACHCKDDDQSVYWSATRVENLINSFVTFIVDQKQNHIIFAEYE